MENKYIRPMGLGEWLDASVKILWYNLKVFVGIALVSYILAIVSNVLLTIVFAPGRFVGAVPNLTDIIGAIIMGLFLFVVAIIVYVSMSGALVYAADRIIHGEKTTVKEAYKAGFSRFWALLANNILLFVAFTVITFVVLVPVFMIAGGFGAISNTNGVPNPGLILIMMSLVFLGFIILIIPILILTVYTILRNQAIVIEKAGPWEAFKRSFVLIKGNWWRSLGYGILAILMLSFLTYIFVIPSYVVTMVKPTLIVENPLIAVLVNAFTQLPTLVTSPFMYVAITLYYYSLRVKKEGIDIAEEIENLAGGFTNEVSEQ